MILDELCEFADATALSTAGTSTYNVGSSVDSSVARDLGNGQPIYCVIQVTTAVAGTSSTVVFALRSDSSATLAVDGSATTHWRSEAIAEATLVAGFELVFPIPLGPDIAYERYLGIQITVGAAALSAGAINAFLTMDPYGWKAYPEGSN